MGSMHTMEHYSAIERNGRLKSAPTWMGLEKMMLSNLSQTPKDTSGMMPRPGRTQNRHTQRQKIVRGITRS